MASLRSQRRERGLARLLRAKPSHASTPYRYVQFLRWNDDVTVECVGTARTAVTGYEWPMTGEQEDGLVALGFRAPVQGAKDDGGQGSNYTATLPLSEAPRAVRMAVRALQLLGVESAGGLEWQQG